MAADSSSLTTHVLDTTGGVPGVGIPITLLKQTNDGSFQELEKTVTNQDGRSKFLPGHQLEQGIYKLHFNTGKYFSDRNVKGFFPYVEVVFSIEDTSRHFHVPLLLSPYSYSTYRGS